ncbi:hypothetical protein [Ralstonia pseudosolanacearum]|nr:hypothetical protein [Ralstonia pseudosolanacearum]MDO3615422.1 hypothetical protein [Ralstonia pseudosolanacearum]
MADFFAHLNYVNIAKFWLMVSIGWAILEAARIVLSQFSQHPAGHEE